MIMNNLDTDVAEIQEELIVYGGIGKVARTRQDFEMPIEVNDVIRKSYVLLASYLLMATVHAFYCIPSFCIRSFYHLSNID